MLKHIICSSIFYDIFNPPYFLFCLPGTRGVAGGPDLSAGDNAAAMAAPTRTASAGNISVLYVDIAWHDRRLVSQASWRYFLRYVFFVTSPVDCEGSAGVIF